MDQIWARENKKNLSVGNFRILSVVVVVVVAYTNLSRGFKYLLKIPYFIQNYLNVAEFLIIFEKNIIKMNDICV